MRVIVLGGDGSLGWPICLELAKRNHYAIMADNGHRRLVDQQLGLSSLTSITPFMDRVVNTDIVPLNTDATSMDAMDNMVRHYMPDVIIMAAELSRPVYGTKEESFNHIVSANTQAMLNILQMVGTVSPKTHVIYLNTASLYSPYRELLGDPVDRNPFLPSSPMELAHVQNHIALRYAARTWGTKVTELCLGMIWGTQTSMTLSQSHFINRYDHQLPFATIMNRLAAYTPRLKGILHFDRKWMVKVPIVHIQDVVDAVMVYVENEPDPSKGARIDYIVGEFLKGQEVIKSFMSRHSQLTAQFGDEDDNQVYVPERFLHVPVEYEKINGTAWDAFLAYGVEMSKKVTQPEMNPWVRQNTVQWVNPEPFNRVATDLASV